MFSKGFYNEGYEEVEEASEGKSAGGSGLCGAGQEFSWEEFEAVHPYLRWDDGSHVE